MTRKKNSFVLLEILIAFALVSISILPFLRYPFDHMQKQIDMLFEMELQRVAQLDLSVIEEQLYQKQIDPALLFGSKKPKSWSTASASTKIDLGKMKRSYTRKTYIGWKSQKKEADGSIIALVQLHVKYYNEKNKRKPIVHAQTLVLCQQ